MEDMQQDYLDLLTPKPKEKKDAPFDCNKAVEFASRAVCSKISKGNSLCITYDQDNIVCDKNGKTADVKGVTEKGETVYLEVRPTYVNMYDGVKKSGNLRWTVPYQVSKRDTDKKSKKVDADIRVGELLDAEEEKGQKYIGEQNILNLFVTTASHGKRGDKGCIATKKPSKDANCSVITAKSVTNVKYKLVTPKLKKLPRKGQPIKAKLAQCSTMSSQVKCDRSEIL